MSVASNPLKSNQKIIQIQVDKHDAESLQLFLHVKNIRNGHYLDLFCFNHDEGLSKFAYFIH